VTSRPFTVVDHLIVYTCSVHRGREVEPAHYEIHLAMNAEPKTPHLIFLTRDRALYEWALALEGTPTRVDAAWQAGRRFDGRVAQVLSALRAHPEAA
jgi:hypothetical protein